MKQMIVNQRQLPHRIQSRPAWIVEDVLDHRNNPSRSAGDSEVQRFGTNIVKEKSQNRKKKHKHCKFNNSDMREQ